MSDQPGAESGRGRLDWKSVGVVVAVFSAVVSGYVSITSDARAQATKEIAPWTERIKFVEQRQQVVEQKLDELAADTRALYKAVMTGQRQERLERPLDGGQP